jgi:hypothetical protein
MAALVKGKQQIALLPVGDVLHPTPLLIFNVSNIYLENERYLKQFV